MLELSFGFASLLELEMQVRLRRLRLHRGIFFSLVCFSLLSSIASADEDERFLRECLTLWKSFEGLRLEGQATELRENEVHEQFRFQANYARHESPDKVRPFEIAEIIDNPGEPHLDDDRIFSRAFAVHDGVTVGFTREFVSLEPPLPRRSRVSLSSIRIFSPPLFNLIHSATHDGFMGREADADWGRIEKLFRMINLKTLGDETFLGIACKKIQYKFNDNEFGLGGSTFTLLVSPSPHPVVLSYEGASNGTPETTYFGNFLARRVVEAAEIIAERVIPTRVRYTMESAPNDVVKKHEYLIEIDKVEELPIDYVGTWDFNSITGADFYGDVENSTRPGSPRLESKASRDVSYIPFSDSEIDRIRQYILSKTGEDPFPTSYTKIALYALNIVVVAFLGWVFYRRVRFG